MSKTNINFNNKNYEIDESTISTAKSALAAHLDSMPSGDNAVSFAGKSYKIGGTDFNSAKTIVDAKLSEYASNPSAFSGAISELQTAFGNLASGGGSTPDVPTEERLEGDGAEYYTLAPTALSFRSTAPLNELQEIQINGVTVDPSNYTLEEGSTIVTFPIDYLKTLNVGSYEVAVASDSKTVKGDFTVAAPELNEYGFYYNQPYYGYSEALGGNLGITIGESYFAAYASDGSLLSGTYGFVDGGIRLYTPDLTINMVISDDGLYCVELDTMFRLGGELFISDDDYVYIYNEEYGGYVVSVLNWRKSSYKDIKTKIYGKPTVAIGHQAFKYTDGMVNCPHIPDDVTIIGEFAFNDCDNLNSVVLPASIATIGANALCCKSLMNITFNGTVEQWNAITKGTGWNQNVPATYVQCSDGQVALTT